MNDGMVLTVHIALEEEVTFILSLKKDSNNFVHKKKLKSG